MRWPFRSFEKVSVAVKAPILAVSACAILLSGCAGKGEVDATGGISAVRSVCPPVAIPAATGDITLFDPVTSRDQSAIDVAGFMTNVRSTCADATDQAEPGHAAALEGEVADHHRRTQPVEDPVAADHRGRLRDGLDPGILEDPATALQDDRMIVDHEDR